MKTDNKKKRYQDYLNRWQLIKKVEEHEIKDNSFDLLFKQTLSIWNIGNSLNFFSNKQSIDSSWADLQKKWIKSNAGK